MHNSIHPRIFARARASTIYDDDFAVVVGCFAEAIGDDAEGDEDCDADVRHALG